MWLRTLEPLLLRDNLHDDSQSNGRSSYSHRTHQVKKRAVKFRTTIKQQMKDHQQSTTEILSRTEFAPRQYYQQTKPTCHGYNMRRTEGGGISYGCVK